ncbi:TPA: hypothetical protein DDW69_04425 [candidate division CPR2 bacterium]|uniref:NUDIX hydrolase n=1 Tax=candidate division CPR2 bacterium GW2011_GWC1_41_48 TaxID=1618344 RepID=A0A0G0YIC5_UNCC2|nr:MAG: NUDIX hydrolase [candidate division CPR2 bacterium GW2011_GWC2_39_35]KKR29094.1 MAG: NUDIX hydrolase [candidate division CPR2 bacterium GW2011_GWD2_39_7]KKS09291.1 MAG: NUDIX hydrolase [candidate division CPR2 bacterium GW2011_GWC1_41_48]OGB70581.1 MAG: hypothetical protein A2Y26_04555 [candidate division CPR2 bacterium GWD2_39_7]HBG82048.1 hypothetical protein [candidate division CPR2 bacterium]
MKKKVFDKKGRIVEAGGIVFREENGQKYVLLLYRKFHNDWAFPKGHVDEGEDFEFAAIREIKEETGIDTEMIKSLPPDEYYNDFEDKNVVVHMFLLRPLNTETNIEYEGDQVDWVPIHEVEDKLTYPNLRKYFRKLLQKL